MRKIAFLLVVASVALIGCGGGGGGGGTGGSGGPVTPEFSVNTNLLNIPGRVEVTYNTGQGRAPGSITAVIRRLVMQDSTFGDARDIVETQLSPELQVQLDGYSSQMIGLAVPMTGFSAILNGRTFEEFTLEIQRLRVEQSDGSFVDINGAANQAVFLQTFPMRLRAFPGRNTGVTIHLDDAILSLDLSNDIVFDQTLFEDLNYDADTFQIEGSFTDYIAFDISGVPNKPQMTDSSDATRVYFSGDFIGLSGDIVASSNPFEVLVPLNPALEGLISPPNVSLGTNGSYALRQIDPRDLTNTQRIVSKQGIWKEWLNADTTKSPFLNPQSFVAIAFPQNDDSFKQDVVFITLDGSNNITDMYFGEFNYSNNSFAIWPIENVDDGDFANEVNGTLSGLVYRSVGTSYADIRGGSFTVTSGTMPVDFPTTGTFVVYRP